MVEVSTRKIHKAILNKVAYKDIRIKLDKFLLKELYAITFQFQSSNSITDTHMEPYLPEIAIIPDTHPRPAADVPPHIHLDP